MLTDSEVSVRIQVVRPPLVTVLAPVRSIKTYPFSVMVL